MPTGICISSPLAAHCPMPTFSFSGIPASDRRLPIRRTLPLRPTSIAFPDYSMNLVFASVQLLSLCPRRCPPTGVIYEDSDCPGQLVSTELGAMPRSIKVMFDLALERGSASSMS